MLVTMKEMLQDAKARRYAVGMFNTFDLEMAKAVIGAAEEQAAPVIVGTSEPLIPCASLEEVAYYLLPMARRAKVPVAIHFDHGLTLQAIYTALKVGFTSVMYDCSMDSYEGNVQKVADIARVAHGFGATVEGELGHVGSEDHTVESRVGGSSVYTDPAQAQDYAARTGVDALAVAIGNAHGVYMKAPKLDIAILQAYLDADSDAKTTLIRNER